MHPVDGCGYRDLEFTPNPHWTAIAAGKPESCPHLSSHSMTMPTCDTEQRVKACIPAKRGDYLEPVHSFEAHLEALTTWLDSLQKML